MPRKKLHQNGPLPPFLIAVALYAPIVFVLVSLQRWIERRQIRAAAA